MNTQVVARPSSAIIRLISRAWSVNRLLTISIALNLLLIPPVLVAMFLDPKIITGVNGWIKPTKFLISATIYGATFLWLLSYVQRGRRWTNLVGSVTGAALIIEIGLIIMQVVRGTTSHFNIATSFDGAVFSTMGALITLLAVMNLILAIWLLMQKLPDPVFAWGVRWGVLLSFVGMLVAYLMTMGPTPLQMEALRNGAPLTVAGAHSVGVADGGPGLPFVGWSVEGGDLRVPHFFGLHGMQVLPIVGWLLTHAWARRRWSQRQRTALVWTAGLCYLGLIILLTWQALRAQSVIAPDGLTWAAYALLVGSSGLAVLTIDLLGKRVHEPAEISLVETRPTA